MTSEHDVECPRNKAVVTKNDLMWIAAVAMAASGAIWALTNPSFASTERVALIEKRVDRIEDKIDKLPDRIVSALKGR